MIEPLHSEHVKVFNARVLELSQKIDDNLNVLGQEIIPQEEIENYAKEVVINQMGTEIAKLKSIIEVNEKSYKSLQDIQRGCGLCGRGSCRGGCFK